MNLELLRVSFLSILANLRLFKLRDERQLKISRLFNLYQTVQMQISRQCVKSCVSH